MKQFLILIGLFGAIPALSQPACVMNTCCCGEPTEVFLPGGNFEDPPNPVPPSYRITFFSGETYSAWTVSGNSIDLLAAGYPNFMNGNPNGPSQFIDLHGFGPGTISTTLSGLMSGSVYTISLWYAINPGASSATCNLQVAGGAWLNTSWTATNTGPNLWLEKCFTFTAQGTTAELKLIGSSTFATAGMLLDDIRLWKCPMDNMPPVAGNPPVSPLEIGCNDPLPPAEDPQFSDDCANSVTTVFTQETSGSGCMITTTRTWVSADACGNVGTVTQTIQKVDDEGPQFINLPADQSVPCGNNVNATYQIWLNSRAGASASDNCSPAVTWSNSGPASILPGCQQVEVQFIATDNCGNSSSATATFSVEDNSPPVVTFPASNLSVMCDPLATVKFLNWLNTRGGAQATDNCGPVTWSNDFSGSPTVPYIEVTFTATDACMNTVSTTGIFQNPVISETIYEYEITCNPAAAGIFYDVVTVGNCETTTVTEINYQPEVVVDITENTCDPAMAGFFQEVLTSYFGCDSIVNTTITLQPSDEIYSYTTSCNPANVGVFINTLTNQFGCDSTIVQEVGFAAADTTLLTATTCNPAMSGVFTQVLTNNFGCDSVVIRSVSLLPKDTVFTVATTCNPANVGTFITTLSNQFGCDSTIVHEVNFAAADTTQLTASTCDPAMSGVFTQLLSNAFGCDSLVVRTVALLPKDTVFTAATSCNPANVGTFITTLSNQFGCDSIIVNSVTSGSSEITTFETKVCDPDSVGSQTVMLTNQFGCDSIIVLVKSLHPLPQVALTRDNFSGFGVSCAGISDGSASALAAGVSPFQFIWSEGQTTASINALAAGVYTVTVVDGNGCTVSGNIELNAPLPLELTISTNQPDCRRINGGAITVNATGGTGNFQFALNNEPFQSTGQFSGLNGGNYDITVTDENGCTAETNTLLETPIVPEVSLGPDITLSLGDDQTLTASVNIPQSEISSVIWNPATDSTCSNCLSQVIMPLISTIYTIKTTDINGCVAEDRLTVLVDKTRDVYVPNIFTPDLDGADDIFMIFAKPGIIADIKSFVVFDRWGDKVSQFTHFQPNEPQFGWDGSNRGKPANPGVYVWYAEIEFIDGSVEVFSGDVTLVR